ncbi:MAG: hypothetical protein IC227_03640 [Enterococcus lacertideformus]|uniref:Uncharacterized protein n=1 Tax=Enterococcus lacertideformus TaxID=2771493 RepID=A0A931FAP0_9ENTE|nr:hypothetical protein [Enterococcus lacertideformus]
MKESDRFKIIGLDNFNKYKFIENLKKGESNFKGWLLNYKPNDNYTFPDRKKPKSNYFLSTDYFEDNLIKHDSLTFSLKNRFSERLNKLTTRWTERELFTFLEGSFGIRGTVRRLDKNPSIKINFRKYPSGGSMYPVEIFLYINKIGDLKTGFYKYHPDFHLLTYELETSPETYSKLFPMSEFNLASDNCEVENNPFTVFLLLIINILLLSMVLLHIN